MKGQFGLPSVTVAGVLGMFAGIIANLLQSLGNYYAAARTTGNIVPPPHAFNRGIGMEGIGYCLAGVLGTANGSSTYSSNVVLLGLTKVKHFFMLSSGKLKFDIRFVAIKIVDVEVSFNVGAVVSTDFAKAFDLIDRNLLLSKFIQIRVRKSLNPLICRFYF